MWNAPFHREYVLTRIFEDGAMRGHIQKCNDPRWGILIDGPCFNTSVIARPCQRDAGSYRIRRRAFRTKHARRQILSPLLGRWQTRPHSLETTTSDGSEQHLRNYCVISRKN